MYYGIRMWVVRLSPVLPARPLACSACGCISSNIFLGHRNLNLNYETVDTSQTNKLIFFHKFCMALNGLKVLKNRVKTQDKLKEDSSAELAEKKPISSHDE